MKEKLQGGWEKIKSYYTGENKKKYITLTGVILFLIIAAIATTVIISNNQPYETLFTGMTNEEMSAVMSKLTEYGVTDYRIEGDAIKVRSDQEPTLKARLLLEGYPKSGFNYDTYFNNIGMMASESDRNTVRTFELQDRMAAVIRAFSGVRDAVVTISEGSDQRYVLDSQSATPATASVMVTMLDGGPMPESYVDAIGLLVSRSVKGLDFANVSITDSLGNSYLPGTDTASSSQSSSDLKIRLENQVNNRIRNEVMQALAPLYGVDNVRVGVTSTVDVSRSVQETTTYTSPEGAPPGEGIIGHREYDQQLTRGGEDAAAGGVVGAEPNADIQTYMESQNAVTGNETWIKNQGVEDSKVNSDITQRELNSGVVTDVMIAVTINQTVAGDIGNAQLVNHIARAAGITVEEQADKINVLVAPFYNPNADVVPDDGQAGTVFGVPKWILYVAAGVLALLFVLILVLIATSRRSEEEEEEEEEEFEVIDVEDEAEGLNEEERKKLVRADTYIDAIDNILDIKNEKSLELKQDIRRFTEENPEIAAQMIRAWLKGDEADG